MVEQKRSIWPGIALITIGGLILVHKLGIYHFYWRDLYPLIFIILGIWFFVNLFLRKQRGLAFPGTLFLLLGIFFFLRNNYFPYRFYFEEYWPIFLIIVGLAFVVQFCFQAQDWGLLIPGGILLFIGFGFLARTMRWVVPFGVRYYLEQYWPLVLILIGIAIIISSLMKGKPGTSE